MSPPAVTTRGFTNYRDGCWVYETKLTSEYVQAKGVSHLADLKLSDVRGTEGQPLIVPGVIIGGKSHDVLYAADMSNVVHAFDVNSYTSLWTRTLGLPINVTKAWDMWGINPKWGVLGTPVINTHTQTLYLVSLSSPGGAMAGAVYHFHTLSLVDGTDQAPPLPLNGATYKNPVTGSVFTLGSVARKQRPALLLDVTDGPTTVFIAFGSFNESATSNLGWVLAVDVTNTASPSIAATWATGSGKAPGAGIWMAGEGLSMDDAGYIYGMTGNGAFDPATGDYGECLFKLKYIPSVGLSLAALECVDWWAPYTDAGLAGQDPTLPTPNMTGITMEPMDIATNAVNAGMRVEAPEPSNKRNAYYDIDLGSGAPLLVPTSLTGFNHNVLIGAGKTGVAYVTDADNMGKTQLADFAPDEIAGNFAKLLSPPYGLTYYPAGIDLMSSDMTAIPATYGGYTHHVHGSPVCYKSPDHGVMLFVGGENGPVRAFTLNADYSLTYVATGAEYASAGMAPPGGMPGSMLTLSCDGEGTNTAVLWALMPWHGDANSTITPGRLVAYGANWDDNGNLIKLWDSADWNWQWSFNKFNKLTVWNGKVFVPAYDGRIMVLG